MKKLLLFVIILVFAFVLVACDKQKTTTTDFRSIFEDGLIVAYSNDKCGYIDIEGELKIEFIYDRCGGFYDGEAIVMVEMFAIKLINLEGEEVFPEAYQRLYRDLVTGNILYYENNKWGMMDNDGIKITEAIFDTINISPNGWFVAEQDGKVKFIDENAEAVFQTEYDSATPFINGFAAVKQDNKYGFINLEGELVIDYQYDHVSLFNENGLVVVIEKQTDETFKYHLINQENEKIIEDATMISGVGPLFAVSFGDGIYIYNQEGEIFYQEKFSAFTQARGNFISVDNVNSRRENILFSEDGTVIARAFGGMESYIFYQDIAGNTLVFMVVKNETNISVYLENEHFNLEMESLLIFLPNDQYIGLRDNLYGIIDKENNVILAFEYDFLYYVNNEYYTFMKNDLMGLMDLDFNIIIDLEYERLNADVNIISLY